MNTIESVCSSIIWRPYILYSQQGICTIQDLFTFRKCKEIQRNNVHSRSASSVSLDYTDKLISDITVCGCCNVSAISMYILSTLAVDWAR